MVGVELSVWATIYLYIFYIFGYNYIFYFIQAICILIGPDIGKWFSTLYNLLLEYRCM